jgi:hypothetical protein
MEAEKLEGLIERGVSALERLAQDPVIEMETGPPVCPNCEKKNPKVRVSESEADGPLAEFVIKAFCMNCNKPFYAIPLQWICVLTVSEVAQVVEERVRVSQLD